ncbi:MAG: tetratricopeptide repeat protein [Planctomycetaceae bacterium]|jgi:TolA-binding protein|nr:tetratricopeptide repeat protein [Planctomycetaceae bacterium]
MNRVFLSTFLILFLLLGHRCLPVHCVLGGDAENTFNAAKTAYDNKQYETARSGFDAFLKKNPAHKQADEAKFWLAESLMYLGQYAAAETYYNQLTGLDTSLATAAAFRLCDIPYLEGKFDVAKPRLEAFVDKYPHDKNLQFVLYYLGDMAMRSGGAEEAEFYFSQCGRMFPDAVKSTENKFGLAWAKNKLGKQTEANALFQQLLTSTTPATAEQAMVEWSKALFDRGDYNAAITALLDFQRKYPNSQYFADSQRVLARCKTELRDFEGALQVLSQIAAASPDDKLQKARCLYGLNRKSEAQTVLAEAERTAGTAYKDEIALFKSVFLYEQQDYKGTATLLESLVLPQYDAVNNKMMFNYSTLSQSAGIKKLSDEAFFKACSLLALSYAKSGDTAKASAALVEMQGQATLIGGTKLAGICTETASQLAGAGVRSGGSRDKNYSARQNGTQITGTQPNGTTQWTPLLPNPGLNPNYAGTASADTPNSFRNRNQWKPSGQSSLSPAAGQNGVMTSGTDLDRFWRAMQFYEGKNYGAAAAQLEQVLLGQYNPSAVPKQYLIFYNVTGADGTLDEATFTKACSVLVLAKAQLGGVEEANAVLAALTPRIKLTDNIQKQLLQETYNQLANITRSVNLTPLANNAAGSLVPETEQRRLLREANALYNTKKFSEAETKLAELIQEPLSEANLAEALLLQSKTKYKVGKDTEGIAILERIAAELTPLPQYADALWYLGLYYDSCGDTVKSVEYFQTLADKFPNSKNIDGALYFLALDDLTNGSGRKANTYLLRACRNCQNGLYWTHATWLLAYEAFKKKNYAQSEMYVQKILDHPPDAAVLDRTLYLKGALAMNRSEYETAFLAFREVGKLCPDSPLYRFAMLNAQSAAGKTVIK